jgi:hypothetical protein
MPSCCDGHGSFHRVKGVDHQFFISPGITTYLGYNCPALGHLSGHPQNFCFWHSHCGLSIDFTSLSPPRHIQTQSYPASTVHNSIAQPANIMNLPILASPREVDDDALFSVPRVAVDLEETSFPVLPVRHHPRGYFDESTMVANSRVRRTSHATPRIHSFDDLTPVSKFHPSPSI